MGMYTILQTTVCRAHHRSNTHALPNRALPLDRTRDTPGGKSRASISDDCAYIRVATLPASVQSRHRPCATIVTGFLDRSRAYDLGTRQSRERGGLPTSRHPAAGVRSPGRDEPCNQPGRPPNVTPYRASTLALQSLSSSESHDKGDSPWRNSFNSTPSGSGNAAWRPSCP